LLLIKHCFRWAWLTENGWKVTDRWRQKGRVNNDGNGICQHTLLRKHINNLRKYSAWTGCIYSLWTEMWMWKYMHIDRIAKCDNCIKYRILPDVLPVLIIRVSRALCQRCASNASLGLKPGFHYPSWRPELTGDRFLLPVNTGRVDWRAFPLAELTAVLTARQLG